MSRLAVRIFVLGLAIGGAPRAARAQAQEEPPEVLPYEEDKPIPPGYELRSRPRWGLAIPGAAMFGAAYGFAVVGAVDTKFKDKGGFLLIPVFGPWLMIGAGGADDTSCRPEVKDCVESSNQAKRFVLGLDGVIQLAGAVMITTGLLFPRERLERKSTTVSLLPAAMGEGRYGAVLVGAF